MIKTHFLIVDDSATLRRLVRQVIENRIGALAVNEAHDGFQALEILKGEKITFIISDQEMPNMSGLELLGEVRKNPEWAKIPFLMLTGRAESEFILTAIEDGVTDYIVKPFTAKELEEKVRRAWTGLSRRKSERYYKIPPHTMALKTGGREMKGLVKNLSRGGVLLELDYHPSLRLCKVYELDMEFRRIDNDEKIPVKGLTGFSTRLELIEGGNGDSRRCFLALWFDTASMTSDVDLALNRIIRYLASLSPEVIK